MSLIKSFLTFLGNVHVSKHPLFIQYKPKFHKLKGNEMRMIMDDVKAGDILLRRYDGYLNVLLTPGFYSHSGICIKDNKTIMHMLGQGLVKEDILNFCKTDSICILRCNDSDLLKEALIEIERVQSLNLEYDFEFETTDNQYYCTELIDLIYKGLFKNNYTQSYGKKVLIPDSLLLNNKFNKITEIKHV